MVFLENFDVLKYFLIIFLHDKINFTFEELDHRKRVSQLLLFYWSLFFFICWKSLIQAIWYKHSFHFFLVVCKIAISWKNRHYKICFFTWLELSQPSFTLNFICLSIHWGHFLPSYEIYIICWLIHISSMLICRRLKKPAGGTASYQSEFSVKTCMKCGEDCFRAIINSFSYVSIAFIL